MKSKSKRSKKSIYAFIDSQNLNLGVRSQGWQLDFKRFRVYLKDKYKVNKAFLFIGYIPKNKKLYDFLKKASYILIFKPVLESKRLPIKTKGNVDAELVLHAMIEFPKYNKAIIVSGDGDFYCLIDYLRKKNKLKKIIVPNKAGFSSLLRKFREYVAYVRDFRNKVERSKYKKRGIILRTSLRRALSS